MPLRPTIRPQKSVVPKSTMPSKGKPRPAKPSVIAVAKKIAAASANADERHRDRGVTFSVPRLTPKGMLRCTSCNAVYYDKHWHSASLVAPDVPKSEMVPSLCDACHDSPSVGGVPSGWGGEVTLEGVPPASREDVLSQVRAIAKRAGVRNAQSRVLKIIEKAGRMLVYTTDNQLAAAIGKEVHEAHKGGTLTLTWSDDDKPVRVLWKAKA